MPRPKSKPAGPPPAVGKVRLRPRVPASPRARADALPGSRPPTPAQAVPRPVAPPAPPNAPGPPLAAPPARLTWGQIVAEGRAAAGGRLTALIYLNPMKPWWMEFAQAWKDHAPSVLVAEPRPYQEVAPDDLSGARLFDKLLWAWSIVEGRLSGAILAVDVSTSLSTGQIVHAVRVLASAGLIFPDGSIAAPVEQLLVARTLTPVLNSQSSYRKAVAREHRAQRAQNPPPGPAPGSTPIP